MKLTEIIRKLALITVHNQRTDFRKSKKKEKSILSNVPDIKYCLYQNDNDTHQRIVLNNS